MDFSVAIIDTFKFPETPIEVELSSTPTKYSKVTLEFSIPSYGFKPRDIEGRAGKVSVIRTNPTRMEAVDIHLGRPEELTTTALKTYSVSVYEADYEPGIVYIAGWYSDWRGSDIPIRYTFNLTRP